MPCKSCISSMSLILIVISRPGLVIEFVIRFPAKDRGPKDVVDETRTTVPVTFYTT
jgi:hypothetical protein